MATLLDETLIADTLESLPGWRAEDGRLCRDVHLGAETDAELRHQIEVDSGAMHHEPSYEAIEGGTRIVLTTPEAGGITELDVMMASHISDLVHRLESAEPGIDAVSDDEALAALRPSAVD